jgi:hypothetical protein
LLNTYLTRTQQLLQYPAPAAGNLYSTADLTSWINQARGQIAGETECCRYLGNLTTNLNVRNYNFSQISLGLSATTGLAGVINARQMLYAVASGYQWIRPRPWSWYWLFKLNNPVPQQGAPQVWSQFSQGGSGSGSITGIGSGSMTSGSFYLDPPPDLTYVLLIDCSCYPNALAADTDVEAIPYLYTDAIPYFAAYLALMSAQSSTRLDQAQRLFDLYKMFAQRADQASAPNVNRYIYERQSDPTVINKLGVQKSAGGEQ